MPRSGLFVGLLTLDLIYLVETIPDRNQKIVAQDYTAAAGGPATNAAVTFSYLGDRATLVSVVGQHPISQLIRADLQQWGIQLHDLEPTQTAAPPTASILVTQASGERAVVSLKPVQVQPSLDRLPVELLKDIDILLIDGHQLAIAQTLAGQAKALNIPIVLDAGSWKSGLEHVLPMVDYAICSANFYPPGCHSREAVFACLRSCNIPHIAVTQGEQPIQVLSHGEFSQIPVPPIRAVDTVAAGDIFHGAFCHYILQSDFSTALAEAAAIAAVACQSFGTRRWMEHSE